jgi:hypothetical protein
MPYSIDVFLDGEDYLVQHYMNTVLEKQYLLSDQKAVREFIRGFLITSRNTRETVCLLAAIHRHALGIMNDKKDIDERDMQIQHRLIHDGQVTSHPSAGDAMAGLIAVSNVLFLGGSGPWLDFLQLPITFSQGVLHRHPHGPKEALIHCDANLRFIIKTSMWFDVLASVSRLQIPQFLNEYRQIFGRNSAYIESPISMASPREELSMMSVMGCESHIVWAMAEISNLDVWKFHEMRRGQLSMPDLVARGKEIEIHLMPGPSKDRQIVDELDRQRHFTSEMFRASSLIYLHTVISGSYPHCPDIRRGVQDTVDILREIPLRCKTSRNVVRSVVFCIFIAGCLTDDLGHREYFQGRLSEQENERVGNCEKVKHVMQSVWEQGGDKRTEPVPWQEALQKVSMLLV